MSHMKEISIRELHRNTGAWVRGARKHGAILVRDRGSPVALLTPCAKAPAVNRFERWRPLKRFSPALDKPVRGMPLGEVVSTDRDR